MRRFPSPAIEPFLGITAFFVTFFLIGLWHGQTSVFALYGIALALGVSVNKLYQLAMIRLLGRKGYRSLAARALYQTLARGLTFTWFNLSLVCFWGNWEQIAAMINGVGAAGIGLLTVVLIVASSIVLGAIDGGRTLILGIAKDGKPLLLSRYVRVVWGTALATVAVAVLFLMATPAPDVVYKVF
jgi:hypothetical protein